MRKTIALIFVLALLLAGVIADLLAHREMAVLKRTLTACQNTPAKLAKELSKKEMAVEIARTKKDRANRAWGEYLRGRPQCPSWGECVNG